MIPSYMANRPIGDNPESEIERNIGNGQCYTFHYGGKIIGGMYLKQLNSDEYRLKRIWINRKDQNYGIGTVVLREIEGMITGCKKICLYTPYKSFRNHHFYEKNGYVKIEERKTGASKTGRLDSDFTLFEYEKRFS